VTQFLRILTIVFLVAIIAPDARADARMALCPDGYAALSQNDAQTAVGAFETCLADRFYDWPQEAELRTRLGAAHLALGQADDALIAYNQIFALVEAHAGDVDNPLIRRNRAAAYLQLGRPEEALTDLQIARTAIPGDAFASVLAGSAFLDLERPEEAVAAFDAAIREEPDYLAGWVGRSAAFVQLGYGSASVSDAQTAVSLAPRDPGALNALCWALVQDDRAADGVSTCRAASDAAPDTGSITHSLAAALEQIGETEQAHRLYARAYAQAPEDPEIAHDYQRTRARTP